MDILDSVIRTNGLRGLGTLVQVFLNPALDVEDVDENVRQNHCLAIRGSTNNRSLFTRPVRSAKLYVGLQIWQSQLLQ